VCLQLGDELNLFEGQATLLFESQAKEGPHEVDVYSLRVEGLLEAQIRLRPVHSFLRQPGRRHGAHDAEIFWRLGHRPTYMACSASFTARIGENHVTVGLIAVTVGSGLVIVGFRFRHCTWHGGPLSTACSASSTAKTGDGFLSLYGSLLSL